MTEIPAQGPRCAWCPQGLSAAGAEALRFAGMADPGGTAKGKGSAAVTPSSFTLALFQS